MAADKSNDVSGQSHLMSLVESLMQPLIGYFISLLVQFAVFPLYGFHPTIGENLTIGLIFFLASFARSYLIRRIFNRLGTPKT